MEDLSGVKFYRIISLRQEEWVDEPGYDTSIDFIAKVRSDDPNSLECILDERGDFYYLVEHIDENKGEDLITLISEYDFMDYYECEGLFYSMYVDEITEEEYNDSAKWKDAELATIPKQEVILSSAFTIKLC
jgi:hypothetical protein